MRLDAYKAERNHITDALGKRLHNGSDPKAVARVIVKAARAWYPDRRRGRRYLEAIEGRLLYDVEGQQRELLHADDGG